MAYTVANMVNITSSVTSNTHTITDIDEDYTISVEFEPIPRKVMKIKEIRIKKMESEN